MPRKLYGARKGGIFRYCWTMLSAVVRPMVSRMRNGPFGAPVPTLKLATNTALASRKAGWIDYDAGGLAQGDAWEPHIQALLQLVLDTASGAPTRAEAAGYREIAIWKDGVTL